MSGPARNHLRLEVNSSYGKYDTIFRKITTVTKNRGSDIPNTITINIDIRALGSDLHDEQSLLLG